MISNYSLILCFNLFEIRALSSCLCIDVTISRETFYRLIKFKYMSWLFSFYLFFFLSILLFSLFLSFFFLSLFYFSFYPLTIMGKPIEMTLMVLTTHRIARQRTWMMVKMWILHRGTWRTYGRSGWYLTGWMKRKRRSTSWKRAIIHIIKVDY